MEYKSWFNEIQKTKMNKQNGQSKIYKMVLLLCMLDRGIYDWYKHVKPEEIALNFYRYLTDNEMIREISFGDRGKEMYKYLDNSNHIALLIRNIASLIKNNPMKYWGGNNDYSHAKYNKGVFWIDIEIQPQDYQNVYYMTKQLCLKRIEDETGISFDTRIDLSEEYLYQKKKVDKEYVAETEKETTIMTRIGQGKFRNRLLEKFNRCIICGIENKNLLIASHIKPWNKCNNKEKIDIENGFILCPNHDKLFDRGFITFNSRGQILTSRRIEKDISKLNIKDILLYSLSGKNRKYLEWHREKIFNRRFSKNDIISQNNNFY